MLSAARGLSETELDLIADLERRVVAHDGGRLKLEYGVLRQRRGERVEDLLWWEGDRLVGFLGLYGFGSAALELAGMVDPSARRRGIGSALLDAGTGLVRDRGKSVALLVTPRTPAGGRELAAARGGVLEHSEHFLTLGDTPEPARVDSDVTIRAATTDDAAEVGRILAAAFGGEAHDVVGSITSTSDRTLTIERTGVVVGTLRLNRHGDTTVIYGFAVDPVWQGRGIGRDVLGRVCRQLTDEGAQRVTLEAEVDNERALGLYTSVGFRREATDDYYELTVPPRP